MNVYLVRKIADYKKDIFATFASRKKAIESAKLLARQARSNKMDFDVVTVPLKHLACIESFREIKSKEGEKYYQEKVFSSQQ